MSGPVTRGGEPHRIVVTVSIPQEALAERAAEIAQDMRNDGCEVPENAARELLDGYADELREYAKTATFQLPLSATSEVLEGAPLEVVEVPDEQQVRRATAKVALDWGETGEWALDPATPYATVLTAARRFGLVDDDELRAIEAARS